MIHRDNVSAHRWPPENLRRLRRRQRPGIAAQLGFRKVVFPPSGCQQRSGRVRPDGVRTSPTDGGGIIRHDPVPELIRREEDVGGRTHGDLEGTQRREPAVKRYAQGEGERRQLLLDRPGAHLRDAAATIRLRRPELADLQPTRFRHQNILQERGDSKIQ